MPTPDSLHVDACNACLCERGAATIDRLFPLWRRHVVRWSRVLIDFQLAIELSYANTE